MFDQGTKRMIKKLCGVVTASGLLLLHNGALWGQVKKMGATEPPPKSYVFCYAIVGLGAALGLISICRPGKRRREVRRPD